MFRAVEPEIPPSGSNRRAEPFDHPAWTFEPRLDGSRGIADKGGALKAEATITSQPLTCSRSCLRTACIRFVAPN